MEIKIWTQVKIREVSGAVLIKSSLCVVLCTCEVVYMKVQGKTEGKAKSIILRQQRTCAHTHIGRGGLSLTVVSL